MVKVEIQAIEQKDNESDYYIVFNYLGRIRRALINKKIRDYFCKESFNVGDKIEVLKSINPSNMREFYKIVKVYD